MQTSKPSDEITRKQIGGMIVGMIILLGGAVYASYVTAKYITHPRKVEQEHDSVRVNTDENLRTVRSGKGKGQAAQIFSLLFVKKQFR